MKRSTVPTASAAPPLKAARPSASPFLLESPLTQPQAMTAPPREEPPRATTAAASATPGGLQQEEEEEPQQQMVGMAGAAEEEMAATVAIDDGHIHEPQAEAAPPPPPPQAADNDTNNTNTLQAATHAKAFELNQRMAEWFADFASKCQSDLEAVVHQHQQKHIHELQKAITTANEVDALRAWTAQAKRTLDENATSMRPHVLPLPASAALTPAPAPPPPPPPQPQQPAQQLLQPTQHAGQTPTPEAAHFTPSPMMPAADNVTAAADDVPGSLPAARLDGRLDAAVQAASAARAKPMAFAPLDGAGGAPGEDGAVADAGGSVGTAMLGMLQPTQEEPRGRLANATPIGASFAPPPAAPPNPPPAAQGRASTRGRSRAAAQP